MYLSILKIDSPEMEALLHTYASTFDSRDLTNKRPSQTARRLCAQAIARDLAVKNCLLPIEIAKQMVIERRASGEPCLKLPGISTLPLRISISHSRSWCACLISPYAQKMSVDLEDLTVHRNYVKLADQYFSTAELAYVEQQGSTAFYKLWTAKEAIAKLNGKGLEEALNILFDPVPCESTVVYLDHFACRLTYHITENYICTLARYIPSL